MLRVRRAVMMVAAVLAVVLGAIAGPAGSAAAAPATVESGSFQYSVDAVPYQASLDWDYCLSSGGKYMYLEAITSLCGNQGWGQLWSFSYASNPSAQGISTLEICHSGNHSGTTTMHYLDASGYHTLSDSAATPGCSLGRAVSLDHFYVTWGAATSPSI
jgi:hypothetical protein